MKRIITAVLLLLFCLMSGCGGKQGTAIGETTEKKTESSKDVTGEDNADVKAAEQEEQVIVQTALETESAKDAYIDFAHLQKENEDIFGWLYIPGTEIDLPVLQSGIADDFYEFHDAAGELSEEGALYIEMANLIDMCDFNTVIHGKTDRGGNAGMFHELYRYADADYFAQHGTVYLYIEGNLLTYQIFAAYERENTSLIRTYDFGYIAGCQEFLDDLYTRKIGKNLLENWTEITPYNFLITLTTTLEENADKQYVVVAALVGDAAGTIDRPFME